MAGWFDSHSHVQEEYLRGGEDGGGGNVPSGAWTLIVPVFSASAPVLDVVNSTVYVTALAPGSWSDSETDSPLIEAAGTM